jgi:hypothetical protein
MRSPSYSPTRLTPPTRTQPSAISRQLLQKATKRYNAAKTHSTRQPLRPAIQLPPLRHQVPFFQTNPNLHNPGNLGKPPISSFTSSRFTLPQHHPKTGA